MKEMQDSSTNEGSLQLEHFLLETGYQICNTTDCATFCLTNIIVEVD